MEVSEIPLASSPVATGLTIPEHPRWHDGSLWFTDVWTGRLCRSAAQGEVTEVARIEDRAGGIGWTPDGHLLLASLDRRRIVSVEADGTTDYADLFGLSNWHLNDMVVDTHGRAYVGEVGFSLDAGEEPRPGRLILVDGPGSARVVCDDLLFPNGVVISPDGATLIIAETVANRLTAFDIQPDGSLTNRRVFAELPGFLPDGICLDAEGAVWAASPETNQVARVHAGGRITHRVPLGRSAFACALGGPHRTTLYMCTAAGYFPGIDRLRSGVIHTAEVSVPAAGLP